MEQADAGLGAFGWITRQSHAAAISQPPAPCFTDVLWATLRAARDRERWASPPKVGIPDPTRGNRTLERWP